MHNAIVVCSGCGAKNRVPVAKQQLKAKCGRCGNSLDGAPVTGVVVAVADDTFSQIVEKSPLPVLVDFYSPTCGPCQMVAPIIENIAVAYAGKAVVCKLNTAANNIAASRFQIRGVPTILYFKDGKMVDQLVGAVPQVDIEARLNNYL